ALAFAERSADPKAGASDPARAGALYDRAAAAASSPPQQVAYRFSRARFARQQRDFPAEVRLLQEVLSSAAFRAVPVPGEEGWGTVAAGSLAEEGIRDRVKDYPAAYREFETAAADALDKARQGKDAAQMLAVAQTYPNAFVAPRAMLAAADAYEAAGQHRPATQVLSQVYLKYKDSAYKAHIIEAQARNHLALPNSMAVAIGWLSKGAQMQSPSGPPVLKQPLKIPGGGTIKDVSFAAAAEMLQSHSARLASVGLPNFHISVGRAGKPLKAFLPEEPQWVIADVDQLLVPPRELRERMRHDRVATWTDGKGVSVFAVGQNVPLGTTSVVKATPRGSAWVGEDLLVWTADSLYLLKRDGADLGWQVSVKSLPAVEMLEGEPAPRDQGPAGRGVVVAPGVVVIDNQIVNLRRGRGQFIINGRIAGMAQQVVRARPAEGTGEQIEHVRPVGERVVLATSTGRIAAVDLGNGQVAWQSRVGDTPLDQVVANDDFVAARFNDDYGTQIAALETFGGQPVWRRAFTPENALPPLNLTLSPDGTLLYTLPDRVCGKDLYEPGNQLKFGDKPLSGDGNRMFDGAGGPDQLVVAEGRILAVADQGQFVRQISPDDGREMSGTNALATSSNPNDWNVQVRVVGPRVYVFNSRTVTSYNLDRLDETWTGLSGPPRGAPTVRHAWIGREHVVLLDQPSQQGVEPPAASPALRLFAYGRYPGTPGRTNESGKLDQIADVTHRIGIDLDPWQPVEGGFYYRSVDRKVHFLKGSGQ
ncbi:MAG: PQQ-binding-like beta-propeller repeat protein, partial [Tepidisphaeraceae bacterium]